MRNKAISVIKYAIGFCQAFWSEIILSKLSTGNHAILVNPKDDIVLYGRTFKNFIHNLDRTIPIYAINIGIIKYHRINKFLTNELINLKKIKLNKKNYSEKDVRGEYFLCWGIADVKIRSILNNKNIISVEDGFIRSVGLGYSFTHPLSLVFDLNGIYFDPRQPSDLEIILSEIILNEPQKVRINKIIMEINKHHITKYNSEKISPLKINTTKKIILVPGQVEDDASIIYGTNEINTNYKLLQKVKELNPEAYIIYKPHPDVAAGNRIGAKEHKQCIGIADQIIQDVSICSCILACEEVHTMTSLSGFDALIRGKRVYTYGMPFYAGWGLTIDQTSNSRRQRQLTVAELVYGVLISYPTYYDLKANRIICIEDAIDLIKNNLNNN